MSDEEGVMTDEEWRPIPGYEGHYDVSSIGRVRSHKQGRVRVLRPAPNPQGYLVAYPWMSGEVHRRPVHHLVALAFLGPRPDGTEIRHLDGDRANNNVENLAYGSKTENTLDAVRHGTHPQARKTHCPQGHAYDAVIRRPDGGLARRCRECSRRQLRESRARRRAV